MLKHLIVFGSLLHINVTAQVCPTEVVAINKDGFKVVGGATIGEVDGKRYGIEHLCDGKTHKLILQVDTWPHEGSPRWKTMDILVFPVGSEDLEFVFGETSYPRLKGVIDPELVCLAKVTKEEFWFPAKAWRANRKKGKFELLKTSNIKCENPGWGV